MTDYVTTMYVSRKKCSALVIEEFCHSAVLRVVAEHGGGVNFDVFEM